MVDIEMLRKVTWCLTKDPRSAAYQDFAHDREMISGLAKCVISDKMVC